jgi:hypothetical protein
MALPDASLNQAYQKVTATVASASIGLDANSSAGTCLRSPSGRRPHIEAHDMVYAPRHARAATLPIISGNRSYSRQS